MAEIQWDRTEVRAKYEDMVAVLLSHLHPNAERIDGSGGDGGRDVQIREAGRLDLFELKSFTGRISPRAPNRRSQVERSLENAAKLSPDSWTLVVPTNHNPSELAWFDRLRTLYPFPLVWSGKDWLNKEMGKRPRIYKYFAEDRNAEVVELLTQLQELGTVASGGVPAAVEQLRSIQAQLNDLDPYYNFFLTQGTFQQAIPLHPEAVLFQESRKDDDIWCVSVVPAYRGAERDRPIESSMVLRFDDDEAGREQYRQFAEILHYGANYDVEVRAENIKSAGPQGLELPPGDGWLSFIPVDSLSEPREAHLRVFNASGALPLAGVTIFFDRITVGASGSTWSGGDRTGTITIELRFIADENRLVGTVGVKGADRYRPRQILEAIRVAHNFRRPNLFEIELTDGGMLVPQQPILGDVSLASELVAFVEDVARVQRHAFVDFEIVPREFTEEDGRALAVMTKLLNGNEISVTPSGGKMRASDLSGFGDLRNHSLIAIEIAFHRYFTRTLFKRSLTLGVSHEVGSPWRVFADEDDDDWITFEPSSEGSYRIKLGAMDGFTAELQPGGLHVSARLLGPISDFSQAIE